MRNARLFLALFGFLFLISSSAMAQYPIISAQDVKSWMAGKRNIVLIDTRTPEEYQAGHIPGAINIPAERMRAEAARLPKDKSTPVIFYCRGSG
jgi:rhodanese-related sulfurtransferase